MRDYKPLLYGLGLGLATLVAIPHETYAQQRPRPATTYVTKFPDGTIHFGRDNGFRSYQRNLTHDYQSLQRRLERERLELRNRIKGRPNLSPIRIRIRRSGR